MSKPKMFEKPSGVRDYLPEAVSKLRYIERQALNCMSRWGYEQIVTPTMEFYDTVGMASSTSDHKLFKLLNQRGTAMVLRSDMTAPIARVVSSLLYEEPLPIRLSYHANVFRSMEEEAGREAEFYQTGAELVGDASPEADAEVIALSIACLQSTGIERFKVAVGHHGFLQGLFGYTLPDREADQQRLMQLLVARDVVGYREMIRTLPIEQEQIERLEAVLQLQGGRRIVEEARGIVDEPHARMSLFHLERVWEVLEAYGVSEHLMLDLTLVGDFSYYTGTIFEGYSAELGFPVMSGGRYDNLLQQFGRPAPATGFALKTTRMLDAIRVHEQVGVQPSILIQYDAVRRREALAEATRLRAAGERVVTRRVDDVSQLVEVHRLEDEMMLRSGQVFKDVLTFVQFVTEHG
ncbi:ATP phosphoribosyltransferase regulatory subunit [Paenibacillus sp. UMB4589-SE434]|uniref:ATP phosphoribosyltransferase regulatory subunit n=1 Tax=Paenibacillus sp. UMB4589-SE434 TaxID=3046314 RepID=UPI00254C949C|nr:ATP phosphoribosyltransferase regulatory subunit [Paenibacillus sp. UMB4589-SE434]MDK8183610.1 ATP phosphoribosyltransferase regulatory subunit [Paenibacillus sp. UMB4589-SE434]